MRINDDWRVTSDPYNVILSRRVKNKEGEPTDRWETVGYCRTVHDALEYMTRLAILGTGMEDLKHVVRKVDELHKAIRKLRGLRV